ncbi:hypothetical protein RRG08_022773, partial [Elysia crispata]
MATASGQTSPVTYVQPK